MKRIAAPMVGGLISSTVLTLVVIPAVYSPLEGAATCDCVGRAADAVNCAIDTMSSAGTAD